MQILRLVLALSHPTDEDLSVGAPVTRQNSLRMTTHQKYAVKCELSLVKWVQAVSRHSTTPPRMPSRFDTTVTFFGSLKSIFFVLPPPR
jgi:hypothetical protein